MDVAGHYRNWWDVSKCRASYTVPVGMLCYVYPSRIRADLININNFTLPLHEHLK